jgi:RNA polymerase sigma-70 factor (ECF subfamily)
MPMAGGPEVSTLVDDLFRHHAAVMLAGLVKRLGLEHPDIAEEAVQEAMLQALRLWPDHGVPDKTRGWLKQVAQNKATDIVRRRGTDRRKREELGRHAVASAEGQGDAVDDGLGDDQLDMIFACTHPALPAQSWVALTLKAACGLSVAEIARAFLTAEPTIEQRLVRAKKLIREHGLTLAMPDPDQFAERLDSALQVIYLLFNEGYAAHTGGRPHPA